MKTIDLQKQLQLLDSAIETSEEITAKLRAQRDTMLNGLKGADLCAVRDGHNFGCWQETTTPQQEVRWTRKCEDCHTEQTMHTEPIAIKFNREIQTMFG